MKYKRQDHLIKVLLKYFKGIAPIAIIDLVETLWPDKSQSDWTETNINSPTYIVGKPDITDERVDLITPLFEIANTPGYLSTDYFEAETDLVTGRTIITPKILTPYGGIVTLSTGLTFDISPGGRVINGKFYEAGFDTKTLSAAHATLPRIDVFYIDNTGAYGVLEGTPAANPLKPAIDPLTQYELTFVNIPAGATTIVVDEEVIYNENTEWATSNTGVAVDFVYETDPHTGIICANVGLISNGDTIDFTSSTPKNTADYTTVSFWLKLKESGFLGNFIEAYFKNNGDPVGKIVVVTLDRQSTNWQFVSLNIADFEVPNNIFDGFTLRWYNNGGTYQGLYLDYIKLQKGIDLPVIPEGHKPVTINPASAALASINENQVLTILVTAGDGMNFVDNTPVTLGTPSTIDSTTTNAVTETSHTHALGNISIDNVVSGSPVEYGALYNWYAATDSRNITSSDDWVVPTFAEQETLITYIGGYVGGGYKLKEAGLLHWNTPNSGVTNEYNFSGVGGGLRSSVDGMFYQFKNFGNYLSTYSGDSRGLSLDKSSGDVSNFYGGTHSEGSSLRLFRLASIEELSLADGTYCADYTGNDLKTYKTVKIGTQVWLAENLNETKYRNGDWITGFDGGVYTPISNANWAAKTTEAMCYFSDNEANGGGETPLENLLVDEKVKYDASDPTAGYLSEKVVAGANIVISEGTGADENKVKIAVTGMTPAYNLPTASAGTLGGVKVGSGLSIDGSGVLSANVQTDNDTYLTGANIDTDALLTLTNNDYTTVTAQFGTISIKNFWLGTLAEYNAITTKDASTIYHIQE